MRLRHLALLIGSCGVLAGCMNLNQAGLKVTDAHELKAKGRPVFGAPVAVPGTELIMFPFAVESGDDGKDFTGIGSFTLVSGSSASGGSSGYGELSDSDLRWNNVVFYDPKSGQTRLFLDEPAVITRFHASAKNSPVNGPYILFAVATRDTNGDGLINNHDATVLSRANQSGENKQPLTSADDHIEDIAWFNGWTYLRVRKDSDGDKHFTIRDRIDTYRVNLSAEAKDYQPELILDDAVRQSAFDVVLKSARKIMDHHGGTETRRRFRRHTHVSE